VLLTGAEIDQVTGLLCLRERHAFRLYGSAVTLAALAMNPVFEALASDFVTRVTLAPDQAVSPVEGMLATALDIPGKPPLYLERTRDNPLAGAAGDCLAYVLEAHGRRVVFAPGVAQMTDALAAACDTADLVLFDGTLFVDDEMIVAGEGAKTGRRMGHLPMTGDGSTLEAFASLHPKRKAFIHINNTNPALRYDSAERAQLAAAGWEIAEDGMEIVL